MSSLRIRRWLVVGLVGLSSWLGWERPLVADWPQFRGPRGSSVQLESTPPVEFGGEGKKNIAWHVELPGRGVGGPILVGDQVITTSSSGLDQRRMFVTSTSLRDGKRQWQQEMVARGRPYCHPTSANAAPTPASDGKRIFAFYSSNDLICYDLEGNLEWYRALAIDFPKAGNDVGMSSSPVVADGVVVVQVECQGDSFVAGFDASTGKTLWKQERQQEANWASPTVATLPSGESLFIIQSSRTLEAIVPRSGERKWTQELRCSTIASTTLDGLRMFVPSKGIKAMMLGSSDQPPQDLWENNKLGSRTSSPVVAGEKLYCVNGSVLLCGEAATGKVEWQTRLPEAGSIWATPVVGKTHLYLFTEDGKCFVVETTGEPGKIAATNSLGEGVLGSPALTQDAMLVRSANGLWKIASVP